MNAISKTIDLEHLKLDVKNPRLPFSIQSKDNQKIIEFMLVEASTLELMMAIGENDFFPGEQLLVVKDSENYIVIEGNRRLVALMLLDDPTLTKIKKSKIERVHKEAKYHPTQIPCLVFEKKEDILKYLGFRHITGIKSWRLLEKARYLYSLKEREYPEKSIQEASRNLAKMIGSRKDHVRKVLVGFQLYQYIQEQGFWGIHNLNDQKFHFNYLSGSLNHLNIRKFLSIDLDAEYPAEKPNYDNLKKLIHWFFEKNAEQKSRLIGDSQSLMVLNRVLGHKEAFQAFDKKNISLDNANELTGSSQEVFERFIQNALAALEKAQSKVHKIKAIPSSTKEDLISIRKLARLIENSQETMKE